MWNNSPSGGYSAPPPFPSPSGFPPPSSGPPPNASGYNSSYAPSCGLPSGGYGNPPPIAGQHPPPHTNTLYPPPPSNPYQSSSPSPYPPPYSVSPYPPGPPPLPPRSTYPGQHLHQNTFSGQPSYPSQQPSYDNLYPSPNGPPLPVGNRPMSGPPAMPPAQNQHYGPVYQDAASQNQQMYFQYSQCTGTKKALCIGINYFGQQGELQGCINDAHNVKRFLCGMFGYKEEDIVLLTDDSHNPRQIPTRENMLQAMRWLVNGAKPNDSLFFHYSGHGGQTKDLDGDEVDGYDEVIYPVDFQTSGHVVDDIMHDIMVKPLPPGCRLTAIFDSCHSGSSLDLPFIYSTEGKIKEPNMVADMGSGLLSVVSSYAMKDMGGVLKGGMGMIRTATGSNQKIDKQVKTTKSSPADVISWSGCKDSQTSADTVEVGIATGAMSYAFISVLSANPRQSYQQLLVGIRQVLKSKYSQKPQLSSSHPMDTNLLFIC